MLLHGRVSGYGHREQRAAGRHGEERRQSRVNSSVATARIVITVTHSWNQVVFFFGFLKSGHGSFSATEDVRCLLKAPHLPSPTDTSPHPLHCLPCQPGSCVDESQRKRTHNDEDDDDDEGQEDPRRSSGVTSSRGESRAEVQ